MVATTVLTRAELESIRQNARNTTDPVLGGLKQQAEISMREKDQKKAASANRVSRWKNTLEADSIAKQNWKLQKEAEEEAKRLEIDRKEAVFQEQFRLDTISRVENLLYKESAEARALRSSVLYSKVLEIRKDQIKQQKIVKEGQKGEDAHYHSLLMARISDAEEKERGRKEAQQFKSKCIVRIQKEQLQKSREAVLAQRRAEMEEGDREKVAIAEQIEEEKRKAKELILQKRVEMERMISANQDLRATRGKTCERELEEIAKCEKERETLDRLAAARKKLEIERFTRKQCARQKLIEKAIKDLEERITISDRKEEKEYSEITAKKDAEEEDKQIRRQKQLDDIEWSRVESRRIKKEQKSTLDKEAAELQAYYEQNAKMMADKEHQQYLKKKKRDVELKESQERQAKETRNRRLAEKVHEQSSEVQMIRSHHEERKNFMCMVENEARQLKSKGIRINLLEKNVAQKYGMQAVKELHQLLLSDGKVG